MAELNLFEKLVNEISSEERSFLSRKFASLTLIKTDQEFEQIENRNKETLDEFLDNYKLNLWDRIILFIRSFFHKSTIKEYIIKKELKNCEAKLSVIQPKIYNSAIKMFLPPFIEPFRDISEFYMKNREFITYFSSLLNEQHKREGFLIKYLEFFYDETCKMKAKQFETRAIESLIEKEQDYKKKFNDYKNDFIKTLKTVVTKRFNQALNSVYEFVQFFNLNFEGLIYLVNNHKSAMSLELTGKSFTEFLKKCMVFPFEKEIMLYALTCLEKIYKSIEDDFTLTEGELKTLFQSIIYYVAQDKGINVLKLVSNNPVYSINLIRFNFDYADETLHFLERKLEDRLLEIENELKKVELEKLREIFDKLELRHYELSHLDKEFNGFLKSYNLPSVFGLEKFDFLISFYYFVWIENLVLELNRLLKERFYLFDKSVYDKITDAIKNIDYMPFELDKIDDECRDLKVNITREMKDNDLLKNSEKNKYYSGQIYLLSEKLDVFYRRYSEEFDIIDKYLSYNSSDEKVKKMIQSLKKFVNILKLYLH